MSTISFRSGKADCRATAIVLVPGLLCSPRFYAKQLPHLWRRGAVLMADHRRDESIAGIARRILANAPRRFALVGHSMGGYIALEVMRLAPKRVVKLALLNTTARSETAMQTSRRLPLIAMTERGGFHAVADTLFPRLVHADFRGDPELREVNRQMAEDTGAEAFMRQQRAIMGRADFRQSLRSIACPTLVVVGDSDLLTPPTCSEEIAAGVPDARLVVIPACGHMCAMEKPESTSMALLQWLDRQGDT